MNSSLNRRDVLRLGLVGAGLGATAVLSACNVAGVTVGGQTATRDRLVEPDAGKWKTWVLTSGSQFRPSAPQGSDMTQHEIEELRTLARQRDAAARERIAYWDAATPAYHWLSVNLDQINQGKGPGKGANASRPIALVNVAMYEATIAAWDAPQAQRGGLQPVHSGCQPP